MKMQIDRVTNIAAAGPPQATCGIVPQRRGPRDVEPAGVAVLLQGNGDTVRCMLTPQEARVLGEMLITCGCVAEGGPPPVLAPAEPPSPILVGGRH